jgi:hypothetical protein
MSDSDSDNSSVSTIQFIPPTKSIVPPKPKPKQKKSSPIFQIKAPNIPPKKTEEYDNIEFSDTVKNAVFEAMTLPMTAPTKRVSLKAKLVESKTCNKYIEKNLYLNALHACNDHIKFALTYSYLFYKTYIEL